MIPSDKDCPSKVPCDHKIDALHVHVVCEECVIQLIDLISRYRHCCACRNFSFSCSQCEKAKDLIREIP